MPLHVHKPAPHGHGHGHGHAPPARRWSWLNLLSAAVLVATACFVALQLLRFGAAAKGSRATRMFGRGRLHRVVSYTEYQALIPELLEHNEPHFVAFTSGLTEGGHPWCRDCAAAMPIIREVVLGAGGSLLEVSAGERSEWGNKQHPIRIDAKCPVRFIPTLYYWTADGCGSKIANPLNDDESSESLRLLVAKFVKETAAGKRYVDRITREIIESGGKSCGGC